MRKQLQTLLYLSALGLVWFAPPARAAEFKLTSAGPANLGGVYTSPYTASINGGADIKVFCDDYVDEVWVGESWNVTSTALSQLPLTGTSSPVLWDTGDGSAYNNCPGCTTEDQYKAKQAEDYITAALVAERILGISNPSVTPTDELLSFALWRVFSPSAGSGLSQSSQIDALLAETRTQARSYITTSGGNLGQAVSSFSNVVIYTAIPKSAGAVINCPAGPGKCSTPQEFISVQMAEAPFSATFALDLLGVAGLLFLLQRRKARTAN